MPYFPPSGGSSGSGGGTVPTFIAVTDTFTVAADTQVLFHVAIELDGEIVLDGVLVWVA